MRSRSSVYILCLAFLTLSFLSWYLPGPSQEVRGLYVNDFKYILGHPEKEAELLSFVKREGFNYLLLYNLGYIHRNLYDLTKAESSQVLARFIQKAKTEYGVAEVGAVGESARSVEVFHRYNKLYTGSRFHGIDVYNLEFESWNKNLVEDYYCHTYLQKEGLDCDSDGAFEFYLRQLEMIREKAHAFNLKCETYIGKPTPEQCARIGAVCDRVLVHYYRHSDVYNNGNSIYQYNDYRLPALAPKEGVLQLLPIFSARERHMGPWLEQNSRAQAYATYHFGQKGFREARGDWKEHIDIQGTQWYRYTDLRGK